MTDLFALLVAHGPAIVFLATVASRLGLPVSGVPFLIVAGALSASGQVSLPAVVAASLLGNLVGDSAWFLAGRRWGYGVMRLLCRVAPSADTCMKRSEANFGRWGGLSLLAAKFVPGVSLVAPPLAGALGMSNRRFLGYELLAASVWTAGVLIVGRLFKDTVHQLLGMLPEVGLLAATGIATALIVLVSWRYVRRAARRTAETDGALLQDAVRAA